MPGVGIDSAAVIIAEIAEIHRFVGASYAALVPSTRSSDAHVRHGRSPKKEHPGCVGSWSVLRSMQLVPVHGSLTSISAL